MLKKHTKSFFLLIVLYSASLWSVVDMKNANYSHSWVDVQLVGSGYEMKVSRTYNSRTLFSGMFGYGWCSTYETKIRPTPEGNIELKECGAGSQVVYYPSKFKKKSIDKTVESILAQTKKKGGQSHPFQHSVLCLTRT